MNSKNHVKAGFPAHRIILRPALIKKMRKISAKKHIFLTAPGGYGKTTVANSWLSSARGRAAKFHLNISDNDSGVFYRNLASALLKLVGKRQTMPDTAFTIDVFLEYLSLMPQRHERCHLVIDDVHIIKNENIVSGISVIAPRLPDYIRLCVAGRSEPSPALLKTGLFEVLTQGDLVFSPEEVEYLGAENGHELTMEQIHDLLKTTGGWAIYLSALLSGGQDDKTSQTLAQYLDTKVWAQWDDETRKLLLRLAVPAEITPALCESLTGRRDGRGILENLIKTENAFLSDAEDGIYRFHDIFRDYLSERSEKHLGRDEIRRLNDITAQWYYGRGDYYTGARYYINNLDDEGISRCIDAVNLFQNQSDSMSVEKLMDFTTQCIMRLPPEFISQNPYLIAKCAIGTYNAGDAKVFLRYIDMLSQKMPEIMAKNPELVETVVFYYGIDHRAPFKEYMKRLADRMPCVAQSSSRSDNRTGKKARISIMTQNLPFFHRSMRDFSEFHELKKEDLNLIRNTFGVLIGSEYDVIEHTIMAGIYYERGDLLNAVHHAMLGYHSCEEWMSPETVFCAFMILAAVLYAMGDDWDAGQIMLKAEDYINTKARFLNGNFRSLQTERAIRNAQLRGGSLDAAREWLAVHAGNRRQDMPFYKICRHFTTLRSHIALAGFTNAIDFGRRLETLSFEYNRPLDRIESGLLLAIALWKNGKKEEALEKIKQVIRIAMPYGFIQLFINEGKDVLPVLLALREKKASADLMRFAEKLTARISGHHLKPDSRLPPRLSAMRRKMLGYLEKDMSYSEIADETGLAHGTVKRHILLLYKQLGVHSAQEAVVKAKLSGLLN